MSTCPHQALKGVLSTCTTTRNIIMICNKSICSTISEAHAHFCQTTFLAFQIPWHDGINSIALRSPHKALTHVLQNVGILVIRQNTQYLELCNFYKLANLKKVQTASSCGDTLHETNSSALKIGLLKRKLIFQSAIFRCYVSFREGRVFRFKIEVFKNSFF